VANEFSDETRGFPIHVLPFVLRYRLPYLQPWTLEGFFPWGPLGVFQNVSRGAKSGEICFFPLEINKTAFFAKIFKIYGRRRPPLPLVASTCDEKYDLIITSYSVRRI